MLDLEEEILAMKKEIFFKCSLVSILAAVLILVGCQKENVPIAVVPEVQNADDQQIYAAIIKSHYNKYDNFVVAEQTSTYFLPFKDLDEAVASVEKRLPDGTPKDLVQDFFKNNKESISLVGKFDSYIQIANKSQLNLQTDQNGVPKKSIVRLSQIGFNRERNQAFVYTSIISGPKNGSGDYVILKKENGDWIVKKVLKVWLS